MGKVDKHDVHLHVHYTVARSFARLLASFPLRNTRHYRGEAGIAIGFFCGSAVLFLRLNLAAVGIARSQLDLL